MICWLLAASVSLIMIGLFLLRFHATEPLDFTGEDDG